MGFSNETPIQAIRIGDRTSRTTEPLAKFRPLTCDTDGNDHPSLAAEYALYLEPRSLEETSLEHLVFEFRAALPYKASLGSRCGKFTANLWQQDCAEFFLCNPSTGRYLEFNLNPHGAWWSASFNAPREHHCDEPFENVQCAISTNKDQGSGGEMKTWSASMSVPLDPIESVLENSITNLTANVTAILSSPNQLFLTAAPLGGEEPDFHRPMEWLPVRVDGRLS